MDLACVRLVLLLACLGGLARAVCPASFASDPSPGLAPPVPLAELAAAGPPAVPCRESRVVRHHLQAAAPASWPPRSGCPHAPAENLVPLILTGRAAGANVDVTGRRVLRGCDVDGTVLGRITVKSGALLVLDDSNINLHVREILVEANGRLVAGSPTCPLFGTIDVMFHGTRGDSSHMNDDRTRTSKGLVVEGTVSFYGKKYAPTWTRLAKTANAGDQIIFVQHATNWEVGQRVLVTTSAWYDCPPSLQSQWCGNRAHQNEVVQIQAITMDRANQVYAIKLATPLQYLHYGGAEYQAEVALMDRRIKLWGANSNDGFGVHVLVLGSGKAQLSGVWVDNGGQEAVMARYPIHLHVLRESPDSFVEDCLVTNSNFRAITVHATNSSRFSRNVGYNIKGMAFYLEDGVEENNLIEHNLMAHISPIGTPADGGWGQGGETLIESDTVLLPADASASGFYVSNAYNTYIGNAASGGWSGFAFPNIPRALGIFKDQDYGRGNPMHRPTKEFIGNTAHSSGFYWRGHGSCFYTGAWIDYVNVNGRDRIRYHSGRRDRDTFDMTGAAQWMTFVDTKAWACGQKGIAHWGNRVAVERYESYDNKNSAMFFGETSMVHAFIKARTANTLAWQSYNTNRFYGFQWYDTWVKVILSDVTFSGFKGPDQALAYLTHSDQWLPQGINAARGIKWEDSDISSRIGTTRCGTECGEAASVEPSMAAKIAAVYDWDGSVVAGSLAGSPALVGSKQAWWGPWSDCQKHAELGFWACPWTANRHIAYIQPYVPDIPGMGECDNAAGQCDGQRAMYTVGRMQHWGRPQSEGINMSPWKGVTGLANTGWLWRVQTRNSQYIIDGAPSKFVIDSNFQMPRGTFVVLAIRYPAGATFTPVNHYNWGNPKETPIPQLTRNQVWQPVESSNPVGLGYHFDNTYLYLRIVSPGCYTGNQCADSFFQVDDVKLWDIRNSHKIIVNAQCPGCAVQTSRNGITFWSVADTVPAAFPHSPGAAGVSLPPSIWNRPNDCVAAQSAPPTTAALTNAPTTAAPTNAPTTVAPTNAPTTVAPTNGPTTAAPTNGPTTAAPTNGPTTVAPTNPATNAPTTASPGTSFRVDPADYPASNVRTYLNGNMILRWAPQNGGKIRIALEARTNGWLGFGIASSPTNTMQNADVIMGHMSGNSFLVEDRFSVAFGIPELDTEMNPAGFSNIELSTGGVTNGQWTSMEFTRPIASEDPTRDLPFVAGSPTRFILAFGTSHALAYHGGNRIVDAVQFLDAPPANPDDGSPNPPPPPPPPPANDPNSPVVPCTFAQPHTDDAYRPFLMRLNQDWSGFDCSGFLQSFANFLSIRSERIKVILAKQGSVILELQVSHDASDADPQLEAGTSAILDDVAAGSPKLRAAGMNVMSASSGALSATVPATSSGGLPAYLLAVIIVGALIGIALIVLVTVLIVRHYRRTSSGGKSASTANYMPLTDYRSPAVVVSAAAPPPVASDVKLTLTAWHAYAGDPSNHILACRAGQKFSILQSDWAEGGEWVWAVSEGQQGYVPRSAVH